MVIDSEECALGAFREISAQEIVGDRLVAFMELEYFGIDDAMDKLHFVDGMAQLRTIQRQLDPDGNILPLVDAEGYIKLNYEGPDVFMAPDVNLLTAVDKKWMRECKLYKDPTVVDRLQRLLDECPSVPRKTKTIEASVSSPSSATPSTASVPSVAHEPEDIPVVYVYAHDGHDVKAVRRDPESQSTYAAVPIGVEKKVHAR